MGITADSLPSLSLSLSFFLLKFSVAFQIFYNEDLFLKKKSLLLPSTFSCNPLLLPHSSWNLPPFAHAKAHLWSLILGGGGMASSFQDFVASGWVYEFFMLKKGYRFFLMF